MATHFMGKPHELRTDCHETCMSVCLPVPSGVETTGLAAGPQTVTQAANRTQRFFPQGSAVETDGLMHSSNFAIDSVAVCSGNGLHGQGPNGDGCVGDVCVCEAGWWGLNCQYFCDAPTTCSDKGACGAVRRLSL